MNKKDKRSKAAGWMGLFIILAVFICGVILTNASDLTSGGPSKDSKQLVIKVVEDEDLVDIDDYDVPLSSFSLGDAQKNAGTRHIILMSAMLGCVIVYVIYQGRNEKKLISLRSQAAKAQHLMMTENRKI